MTVRTPADFIEADNNLAAMLDSLTGADNYLDFIVELMQPHLQGPILEVGAGLGDLTGRLAADREVVATDVSNRCLDSLRSQFGDSSNILVDRYDAIVGDPAPAMPDEGFGSVVMSNVLEHLPDDRAVLRNLGQNLRPGGTVVVFVPAFELLYGRFDEMIGHHRRYRRRTLEEAFTGAGLEPQLVRYVNLPGWFAWLLTVRLLGQIPTGQGLVRTYDRLVIPPLRAIETRISPPFGQSVLGVATVGSATS